MEDNRGCFGRIRVDRISTDCAMPLRRYEPIPWGLRKAQEHIERATGTPFDMAEAINSLKNAKTLNTMEKKIIGYKLKDEKYRNAFDALVREKSKHYASEDKSTMSDGTGPVVTFLKGAFAMGVAEEAGVLDFWFDPVCEEKAGLEVGKWYRTPCGAGLYRVVKLEGRGLKFYGFSLSGTWIGGERRLSAAEADMPATDEEVLLALTKEAHRRGYKNGNYKCLRIPSQTVKIEDGDGFYLQKGNLWHGRSNNANCVFNDGQWAEVLSVLPALPELGGYPGEDCGSYLAWGCKEISKKSLRNLKGLEVFSISLIADNDEIVVEQEDLERIYEYLDL